MKYDVNPGTTRVRHPKNAIMGILIGLPQSIAGYVVLTFGIAYMVNQNDIPAWQGFAARHSDLFCVVDRAEDLDRAKAAGKCAVIMGVQNSEHFRKSDNTGRRMPGRR